MTISAGSIFKSGEDNEYQQVFIDSVASYKILDESFDDLSRWESVSTTAGSGGALLSGATSRLKLPLLGGEEYALPADEKFVIETTVYVDSGQTLTMFVKRSNAIILSVLVSGDSISATSEGNLSGVGTATLTGLDITDGLLLRFLFDPDNEVIRLFVAYADNSASYITIEETLAGYTFTYQPDSADLVAGIEFACSSAGNATIEKFRIYKPWLMGIGESIMTGLPFFLAGVPSVADYEGSSVLRWLERGFGDYGVSANMGIGGHSTSELVARVPNVITPFAPEWVVIMIGSNDIYYSTNGLATMKINVTSSVDTCISAGCNVVICEILPRDIFTSEHNILKKEWNSWLVEMASSRKKCNVAHVHDTIIDMADDSKIRAPFKGDEAGHINAAAYRKISNVIAGCMGLFKA